MVGRVTARRRHHMMSDYPRAVEAIFVVTAGDFVIASPMLRGRSRARLRRVQ